MASQEKSTAVLWEELDFRHVYPVRTAVALTSDGSEFRLLRENNGRSLRLWSSFAAAFLPEGYPDSVTSDYLSFQLWDTLQGLSTYIRSMLSTQALLSGIGVGQTAATVMGATFQWFMRDFTGMLGGIIFTIYQGSNLDSKAKQWRLTADFMNDIGMLLDLISPLYPKLFVTLLCIGSIARSVTGVASGATRAALTQHFALQQNAADISAKEGSQETAATLSGMLLGMLVANITAGHTGAIWACFLALTFFHMFANYKAVRSLCLTSLNKERANIVLASYLKDRKVPSPLEVSKNEVIISMPSVWFFRGKTYKSPEQRIVFGAKISSIDHGGPNAFSNAIQKYSKEKYLIFHQDARVYVILHNEAKKEDFLKAYIHAVVSANFLELYGRSDAEVRSCNWMEKSYTFFLEELQNLGWNVNRVHVYPENWRAKWYPSVLKSD